MPITINGVGNNRLGFMQTSLAPAATNFDGTNVAPPNRDGLTTMTLEALTADFDGQVGTSQAFDGEIVATLDSVNTLITENDYLTVSAETFHSIGIEWAIPTTKDTEPNATVSVRYRKTTDPSYSQAMDLVRTFNYEWFYFDENTTNETTNNFAGSICFLTPGTEYEVELTYTDPDAIEPTVVRTFNATTRAVPIKPTGGRTLYVIPGSGGGDGSSGDPFQGIAAANAAAIPGDIFRLRNGTYSGVVDITNGGTVDNHIVYEADTGASPVIEEIRINVVGGGWLWFDNLTFQSTQAYPRGATDTSLGQYALYCPFTDPKTSDVVIERCSFEGYDAAIGSAWSVPGQGGARWTVMDNTIVGDKPLNQGNTGPNNGRGYGIIGNDQPGHVYAYNSITQTADGILSREDSDVFANDIFDVTDDNHTSDGAYENVRVWGNRLSDASAYAMTAQPQQAGPWYFLYNQMVQGDRGSLIKWKVQDRLVFIGNTFIGNTAPNPEFMRCITRNNLFIKQNQSTPMWGGKLDAAANQRASQFDADWNTDIDYDGFNWGGGTPVFRWFDPAVSYNSIAAWSAAVNVAGNGTSVHENSIVTDDVTAIFDTWPLTETDQATIQAGTNIIDAGIVVDNLADFHGGTPDLGAYQQGETLFFGPRTSEFGLPLHQRTLHWIKH